MRPINTGSRIAANPLQTPEMECMPPPRKSTGKVCYILVKEKSFQALTETKVKRKVFSE